METLKVKECNMSHLKKDAASLLSSWNERWDTEVMENIFRGCSSSSITATQVQTEESRRSVSGLLQEDSLMFKCTKINGSSGCS